MATSTIRIKINGASMAYPNSTMLEYIETAVKSSLRGGIYDSYDITVNVQATRKVPPVLFKAGDVYQFRYANWGPWYNFVKISDGWSGDITDVDMRAAIIAGNARRCTVTPV
jgi:hypothetical protein